MENTAGRRGKKICFLLKYVGSEDLSTDYPSSSLIAYGPPFPTQLNRSVEPSYLVLFFFTVRMMPTNAATAFMLD